MSTSRSNNTTAGRLSTVEEGLRSQGREIAGLRDDFQDFAREVRNAMAERSRFPWPAIAVIVSILGGLITLGAWGPLREQERQGRAIETLDEKSDRVSVTRFTSEDGDAMEDGFSKALTRQEARTLRFVEMAIAPLFTKVEDLAAEHARLRDKVDEHQKDGDPWRVEEIARGIGKRAESNAERIQALEARARGD